MRVDPDYIYEEYKEGVVGAFNRLGQKGWETASKITDYMSAEDSDLFVDAGASWALWIISVGEYEVRHDILEDRVLIELSYCIPHFKAGEYNEDLTEEEFEQVNADVDYILSKVKLYDKVYPVDAEE